MNIVLIGTGNTATVLGKKLKNAGHKIVQVLGRSGNAAADLARQLDTVPATGFAALHPAADLYVLAVSDKAVPAVLNQVQLPAHAIVVHTAASVPLDVLKGKTAGYGVFYPLQSLKRELEQLPDVPVIIDAGDERTLQQLHLLAQSVSDKVYIAGDDVRLKLHLGAVMVNNFTNHLYALVEAYCRDEGLDFQLLLPLIMETASRLKAMPPAQTQTGPAVRNDTETIAKHLLLLENHPRLKQLYALFTESIGQSR